VKKLKKLLLLVVLAGITTIPVSRFTDSGVMDLMSQDGGSGSGGGSGGGGSGGGGKLA
jgi:hypothetical protein